MDSAFAQNPAPGAEAPFEPSLERNPDQFCALAIDDLPAELSPITAARSSGRHWTLASTSAHPLSISGLSTARAESRISDAHAPVTACFSAKSASPCTPSRHVGGDSCRAAHGCSSGRSTGNDVLTAIFIGPTSTQRSLAPRFGLRFFVCHFGWPSSDRNCRAIWSSNATTKVAVAANGSDVELC